MKISVAVLAYNSKLESILVTLKSIVLQQFDSFEIIVSDDGSSAFPYDEIESFLSKNFCGNYRIIANEINVGTVQHCINVANVATGKYIKLLGAGDLLYAKDTLDVFFDFMEKNNIKVGLGKLLGFNHEDGILRTFHFAAPLIQNPYVFGDLVKIRHNLIFKQDFICGACMIFDRIYLVHALSEIKNYVRYVEDLCEFIAALEGVNIKMLDEYIVCYEHGVGVSFSSSSRLKGDYCKFWENIQSKTDNQREKKRFEVYSKITNLKSEQRVERLLLRILYTPEYFYMKALRRLLHLKNASRDFDPSENCLVSIVKEENKGFIV